MKKKTAGKTSMKKRLLIPIAVAAGMMMTVPAFAQHIYIGDTETVISYDENGNKVITLIFDPAKTPDYMKPESPNYWRKAEQAQAQAEQAAGSPSVKQPGYTGPDGYGIPTADPGKRPAAFLPAIRGYA